MEKKPLRLATRRSLVTSEESLSYRSAGHSWIKEWVGVERLEILSVGYFKKFVHQISNPNNGMKGRQDWEFIFRLGRLECVLGWGAGAIEESEFKSIGERGDNWWVRFCEKWEWGRGGERSGFTTWAGSWRCTKGRHPRYNLVLRSTNDVSSEKYLIPAIV